MGGRGSSGQRATFILGSLESALWNSYVFALGATSEYRSKIVVFARRGQFGGKLQVQGVVPHQPLILRMSENYDSLNVLWYGIRMWEQVPFVLSQCTRLTDGQTYGQKGVQYTVRNITCSRIVKTRSARSQLSELASEKEFSTNQIPTWPEIEQRASAWGALHCYYHYKYYNVLFVYLTGKLISNFLAPLAEIIV